MSNKDSKSGFSSIPMGLFMAYTVFAASFLPAFAISIKWTPFFIVMVSSPAVCLAFWWILAKEYMKRIKPVNERIAAIIHDKPALIPPRSVVTLYKSIQEAGKRISLTRKRMKRIIDYIAMLAYEKNNDAASGMMSKQNEYYNYFCGYYDNYCSLYLDMRLQFYMTVMRDVLIATKKIHRIDIKRFIDTIKIDTKCMGYVLRSKIHRNPDYSQAYSEEKFFEIVEGFEILADIEQTIAFFFNTDDAVNKKSKKQLPEQDEGKKIFDMVLKKTNASIRAVNKKIREATVYLIALQSNKVIGDTSPLDEENVLNMQRKENNLTAIVEYSKTLGDEYDRFIAEVELSENGN